MDGNSIKLQVHKKTLIVHMFIVVFLTTKKLQVIVDFILQLINYLNGNYRQ